MYIYIFIRHTTNDTHIIYRHIVLPSPRLKIDTTLTRHASFAVCENEALVVVHAGRPRAPKPRVTRDDVTERGEL